MRSSPQDGRRPKIPAAQQQAGQHVKRQAAAKPAASVLLLFFLYLVILDNAPTEDWFFVEIIRHVNTANFYVMQRATGMTGDASGRVWTRNQRNGVWDAAWRAVVVDHLGNLTVPGTATIERLAGNLEVTREVTANTACLPNGSLARDGVGVLLSCQSGVWRMASGGGQAFGCWRVRFNAGVHGVRELHGSGFVSGGRYYTGHLRHTSHHLSGSLGGHINCGGDGSCAWVNGSSSCWGSICSVSVSPLPILSAQAIACS